MDFFIFLLLLLLFFILFVMLWLGMKLFGHLGKVVVFDCPPGGVFLEEKRVRMNCDLFFFVPVTSFLYKVPTNYLFMTLLYRQG